MNSFWKAAAPVTCIVAVCGAVILWQVSKHKGNETNLAEDARTARTGAEHGDAKAETNLGRMYYYGDGVSLDYSEALSWYRKAADQGFSGGEDGLAYLYLHGQGVPQNYAEALRWYRKAADQDDAKAQTALALMYSHGLGVPQDYAEALRWYRKAADQSYAPAEYDMGNAYHYGRGVPPDRTEADRWYHRAADQGDAYALRAIGLKGSGLSTSMKADLALEVACSLILLGGTLSGKGTWSNRRRATALAGLVGLANVGMDVYGAYRFGRLQPGPGIEAFYLMTHGLSGAFIVLVVSTIYSLERPHRARMGLKLAVAVAAAFNIVAMMHFNLRHLVPAVRLFWMVNGLLLGMAIPLTVFLWRAGRSGSRDGEVAALEGPEQHL